jgi:hypothetical protein
MSEKSDDYPVSGLHAFLDEASKEFGRFRLQAKVNLVGSIILLVFLSRFLIFVFGNFGPPPFNPPPFSHDNPPPPFFVPNLFDLLGLLAAMGAVLWSVNVWLKQRKFVSRWGDRFQKLDALEKQLLPDDKP